MPEGLFIFPCCPTTWINVPGKDVKQMVEQANILVPEGSKCYTHPETSQEQQVHEDAINNGRQRSSEEI